MIKKTSLYIEEELLKTLKLIAIEQEKKVNDLIIEFIKNQVKGSEF